LGSAIPWCKENGGKAPMIDKQIKQSKGAVGHWGRIAVADEGS